VDDRVDREGRVQEECPGCEHLYARHLIPLLSRFSARVRCLSG
jgi:hypothetical protein